jgi:class 3 adenylate cyclase
MNCGQPLGTSTESDEARQAALTATAPTPLVEKMRSAKLSGERKPVTAVFSDVVGSTTLAERMDPEDWSQLVNEAFELMSQAIYRYEGTIAQLQGDAMLAFFGAPVAHEDDPERAVLAALDMVAAIEEFSRQLKSTQGIDFRIRAGINTGPVLVGNVGQDLRYGYTALGDAMNVAARMQAAAEPGSVVITDNTLRLVAGGFDVEDLGQIAVKGKSEPVQAYRVIGQRTVPGRRRGLERVGLDSPMVGRDSQLEQLQALYEVTGAGRGRVCFLVGEPGIGKSRLLAELRRWAEAGSSDELGAPAEDAHPAGANARPTWVEGRCVSYGRNLPYHLLIDLVRSILNIPFAGTEADSRATLDRQVNELVGPAEGPDVTPYLAHLLDLPLRPDEDAWANVEPDVMQSRYVASLVRLLRALSARGPIILVTEDLHWADPASVEVIQQLLPLSTQLPVLFIAATRAETDSAGWGLLTQSRELFGDALTESRLEPLTESQSRDLVANLLAIESLPQQVRDLILSRAEGNPFFVEEVVRMLIDGGVIERHGDQWVATDEVSSVEIPETLHGLLLARIDQLPDDAKRSLRVAAVIGRQFPVRVLERVLGGGGE